MTPRVTRPGFSPLNIARALKVVALLFFLLPWATVSCSSGRLAETIEFEISGAPRDVIAKPSGLALASGTVRMLQEPPAAGGAPPANPFATPDPFVIAGTLLILAAFGLTFVRRGRLAALAATVSAGSLLGYAIFVRLPRAAQDYAVSLVSGDAIRGSRLDPGELVRMLEVRTEPGFWLTLAALTAAAALLGLSLRPGENAPRP